MRYPASEKLEIIRLVEQAHLPAKQTLDRLGIPRRTFYRRYDRYLESGPEALTDKPSAPSRVWNRIPAEVHDQIIEMALERSELSPRELAVTSSDEQHYFVSEASVYRLLKAHDLITSPALIVMKAASEFKDKTTAINQLWQTDFTYLKIIGWGWYYLSTILDDFSRYIIVTATRRAQDVQDIPVAVTAVSPVELERQSVVNVTQISQVSPSFSSSNAQNSGGTNVLRIRGVGTTSNDPGIESAAGIFIDGSKNVTDMIQSPRVGECYSAL